MSELYAFYEYVKNNWKWMGWVMHMMGGITIFFSILKISELDEFQSTFAKYDFLTR